MGIREVLVYSILSINFWVLFLINMDSIVSQVQTLADRADEAGRNDILRTLRDLQHQLETPKDLFLKLYNSVSSILFFLDVNCISLAPIYFFPLLGIIWLTARLII